MDLGIKGKRSLVLGSSTGLGRAIAESLINEGAKVLLTSRSEERLRKTAAEIGAAGFLPCDLTTPHAAKELIQQAQKELGGLDILVTNAGGPPKGAFNALRDDQWRESFQSLWSSAVDAIMEALPAMQKQKWGRILLVTSISAREPLANLTISNSLRAGLMGLANSLSREVASDGVTVNVLLPGFTDTERLRELGIPAEKICAQIPAGRLGQPKELGALTAFLASEPAAYISGQAIACDGGFLKSI